MEKTETAMVKSIDALDVMATVLVGVEVAGLSQKAGIQTDSQYCWKTEDCDQAVTWA